MHLIVHQERDGWHGSRPVLSGLIGGTAIGGAAHHAARDTRGAVGHDAPKNAHHAARDGLKQVSGVPWAEQVGVAADARRGADVASSNGAMSDNLSLTFRGMDRALLIVLLVGACGRAGDNDSPNGDAPPSDAASADANGVEAGTSNDASSGDTSTAPEAGGPTCGSSVLSGGLFDADMIGVPRKGTPGAFEVCAGADPNGYVAQFECRAGGPECNVDVAALGNRACDQTITTATTPTNDWSAINWSNNTICIQNGDHTGRGPLTIPDTADGTSGNYKALRYTRASDNDDEPWNQSDANRAKLKGLYIRSHYWLVHRLTFPGTYDGPSPRLESSNGATHHIFSRLLVEGVAQDGLSYYGYSQNCNYSGPGGYDRLTVQNSVFRNLGPAGRDIESIAVDLQCGTNLHMVNNEVYDWVSHAAQLGHNFPNPTLTGMVVENNDLYVTPALYANNGTMSKTETPLSVKFNGTPASPGRIIQNRLWGARYTDQAFCCNGEPGELITNYEVLSHTLFQNNILFDAQSGLGNIANNQSAIGNVFWNLKKYYQDTVSMGIGQWKFPDAPSQSNWEIYLNTFIGVDGEYSVDRLDSNNADTRCNVFIASGPKYPATPSSSSQADYNAFYGTTSFAFNGTNTNVDKALSTRANSMTYDVDSVMRTAPASSCANATDAACFLYKATAAGTSAGSPPTPCSTLGCTYTDGGVTWKAFRGPYSFKRKLKTVPGGETVVIPYAKPDASAFEYKACPGASSPNSMGSRMGLGINDDHMVW